MPTVSVIVPTYDRADVLPRSVDSVLEQTYEDIELLVVDDASNDETRSYLESVDDDRLRPIYHEENQGPSAARNTGIEAADGEYVAFLDSDDEWKPTFVERAVARIEEVPEAVAVYSDSEKVVAGATGSVKAAAATLLARADPDRPVEGGADLTGEMLADWLHTGAGSTLLAETAVVSEIDGFDEELHYFTDTDFALRLVQEGYLAHVDESLVVRHVTGPPGAEKIERNAERLLEKHADLVEEWEAKGYDVRGARALGLAKPFLSEGKFRRGLQYLSTSSIRGRHVPGICWRIAAGVRTRTNRPVLPLVGAGVVLAVLVAVWLTSRSNPVR